MIFQTVITQNNNYIYDDYDPAVDNSNLKSSTISWRLANFLRENIGLKVYVQNSPSYKDIQKSIKQ